MSKAKKISAAILADMIERGGFLQVWEIVDDETREEIRATWESLVEKELRPWWKFWGR